MRQGRGELLTFKSGKYILTWPSKDVTCTLLKNIQFKTEQMEVFFCGCCNYTCKIVFSCKTSS